MTLKSQCALLLMLICTPYTTSVCSENKKKEEEIPFTEDLMREHGVLNRVLLAYEEFIRRIDHTADFPIATLEQAATIIKLFIGDYHEKLEEKYIFPLFENDKHDARLVKTLIDQHVQGRAITAKLLTLTTKTKLTKKDKKKIKSLLKQFITMYRPHEARENTVIFPKVRSLMSEERFKELSEEFEESEHQLFGENGFESMVQKIEVIEKELGIYALEQFTPKS